jgi:hypothetical protein
MAQNNESLIGRSAIVFLSLGRAIRSTANLGRERRRSRKPCYREGD